MKKTLESEALVVRTVAYGEADSIVTFVTEAHGRISAMVRGARKSKRRAQAALEPFHTVRVWAEDKGAELVTLKDASVVRVRTGLLTSLRALEAAGLALRWLRHLVPIRHPEPRAFATVIALLDALDDGPPEPRAPLAAAGLRLLSDVGFELNLSQCVLCGRPCPDDRPSSLDPVRGGLVCLACGGAPLVLSAELRRLARAAQEGGPSVLSPPQAEQLLSVVEAALAAHGGFETR